jgi:ornithine cyclodeaminase
MGCWRFVIPWHGTAAYSESSFQLTSLPTMMSFFSDDQIRPHLDYDRVIQSLDTVYTNLAHGQAAILPRQRCAAGTAKFSSMGGLWAAKHVAATKSYPTVNGQFSFLISLFDTDANQPLAVMAAQEITRFRTASQTAMVAARVSARQVRKVALFGAGMQGRAQVEALSHRVSFDDLAIVDPGIQAAPVLNLACAATVKLMSAEQAVRDADVVITATRSQQAVFDGAWLKEGAFVAAIGISSAGGRELDSRTMDRAERVIVECLPQSMLEAGDVLEWLKDSPDQKSKIVDLSQLYAQNWPPVRGIQVFKSVGTGLADTACAWLAWQRLSRAGV